MSAMLRLDAFLPYRLSAASNAVSKVIASAYQRRFNLSVPEWRLIAVLREVGESTQQNLVQRTLMDKVAVSRAAERLVQRALVRRTEDESDGRARLLSLTRKGRTHYDAIAPEARAYEKRLLAALSADEVAALHAMLLRIQNAATALEEAARESNAQ